MIPIVFKKIRIAVPHLFMTWPSEGRNKQIAKNTPQRRCSRKIPKTIFHP